MRKVIASLALIGLAIPSIAKIQENELGKVKSCTRFTDSENETCYTVVCEGNQNVCVSYSGTTKTVHGECVEAGRVVTSTFDGGTLTAIPHSDGTTSYTYVGATPIN